MNDVTGTSAFTAPALLGAGVEHRQRRMYVASAIVFAAIAFIGFAPSYYLKAFFGTPPLSLLVHIHGLLFTTWLLLFIAQTFLVAAYRVDLHRRLGVASACFAVILVVVGWQTAVNAARLGHAPQGAPPLMFLVVPLFSLVVFVALLGAGLYLRRRNRAAHKRLLLLATLSLLAPPIARLPLDIIRQYGPLATFGLLGIVLLACIVIDTLKHRRLHPAMGWGALLIVLSLPIRLALGQTQAWLDFATWLTR